MTRVKRERGGWSVPTQTARWNDRLNFAEVQFTDCARRCRGTYRHHLTKAGRATTAVPEPLTATVIIQAMI
jgi:hypothetical protein